MIPPSEEQMQYMCNYIPEGRATRLKVCISLTFSSPSTLPSLWCELLENLNMSPKAQA